MPAQSGEPPPAFEGAEGFGARTQGGRGGTVIAVTNLNDTGPGSLRAALEATGPRIVQFRVGGTIELQSQLRISNPFVTVSGETAPDPGITLLGHGIRIQDPCHDVILRHLRIRVLTGGASGDGILLWGRNGNTVSNVIVDHCSILWATDENVNTWGLVQDVTFQWCIIAEGQTESDHPEGAHSMGWLSGVGSDRITLHHNLFAHNGDRNPKLDGGLYDLLNNVIYNWGNNNCTKIGSGARVNVIGNTYVAGPQSNLRDGAIFVEDLDKGTSVYVKGNISPWRPKDDMPDWLGVAQYTQENGKWIWHYPAPEGFKAEQPFPTVPVTTQPAEEAYELVLDEVGPRPLDETDSRILREVRGRSGKVGKG